MAIDPRKAFGPILSGADLIVGETIRKRRLAEQDVIRQAEKERQSGIRNQGMKLQLLSSIINDRTGRINPESQKDAFSKSLELIGDPETSLEGVVPTFGETTQQEQAGRRLDLDIGKLDLARQRLQQDADFRERELGIKRGSLDVRRGELALKQSEKGAGFKFKNSAGQTVSGNTAKAIVDAVDDAIKDSKKFINSPKLIERIEQEGDSFTLTKEEAGGNQREASQHINRLSQIKQKLIKGEQLTIEDEEFLLNPVFEPQDASEKALNNELKTQIEAVGNAARNLEGLFIGTQN